MNEHLPPYMAPRSVNLSHTQDPIKEDKSILLFSLSLCSDPPSLFFSHSVRWHPLYSSVFSHPFALVKASSFSFFPLVLFFPSDPSSPLADLTTCHRLTLPWCRLHDQEGWYMAPTWLNVLIVLASPVYQIALMTDWRVAFFQPCNKQVIFLLAMTACMFFDDILYNLKLFSIETFWLVCSPCPCQS